MSKLHLTQETANKVYNTLLISTFLILISLVLLFSSCQSQSGRIPSSNSLITSTTCISDQVFLNTLNKMDSTATIDNIYIERSNSTNIACIVIKYKTKLYLYRGWGAYMKEYAITHVRGDFAK